MEVLWLDVFEEDISYRDLRGLYQVKKPAGLFVAYFATWRVHGSLVRLDSLLKKGYRYGWFVAEGEWGRSIPVGMKLCKLGTSSMKIVCVSFLLSPFLCIYTSLA